MSGPFCAGACRRGLLAQASPAALGYDL